MRSLPYKGSGECPDCNLLCSKNWLKSGLYWSQQQHVQNGCVNYSLGTLTKLMGRNSAVLCDKKYAYFICWGKNPERENENNNLLEGQSQVDWQVSCPLPAVMMSCCNKLSLRQLFGAKCGHRETPCLLKKKFCSLNPIYS